ncbi:hypothetical protein GF340_04155 [Candidatus Peregrinibacteria bacterium]|nr:hypothetical protein [Candidatus Peregrinibacteria bacterium]
MRSQKPIRWEKTGEFQAVSSGGEEITIEEISPVFRPETQTKKGKRSEQYGKPRLQTQDGLDVKKIDANNYEIHLGSRTVKFKKAE